MVIQVLEKLRRWSFWALDALKANRIGNHYDEIKQLLEHPLSEKSKGINKKNLQMLLEHACRSTAYYKPYIKFESISDFPISNKSIILENYDAMKADVFLDRKVFKVSTSGSTGIPLTMLQDLNKKHRHAADTIYYVESTGARIGQKLIYIRNWEIRERMGKFASFMQNMRPHGVTNTSKNEMAHFIYALEKDKSNQYIVGYSSFLEQVCLYLDGQKSDVLHTRIKSVISMAESLNDYERNGLAKYLNTSVYERYSNTENGILAQNTKESRQHLKINSASYYIEVLEEASDQWVPPGSIGRVVVTDLFNYALPMIRYDTGDMALYDIDLNGVPILTKIYGRKMDLIYSTNNKIVSPHIFNKVVEYSKLNQFQFVQTGKKNYTYILNAQPETTKEAEIEVFLRKFLGEDAQISFKYVDEIPPLASGKRKKVVNQYKNAGV